MFEVCSFHSAVDSLEFDAASYCWLNGTRVRADTLTPTKKTAPIASVNAPTRAKVTPRPTCWLIGCETNADMNWPKNRNVVNSPNARPRNISGVLDVSHTVNVGVSTPSPRPAMADPTKIWVNPLPEPMTT